MTQARQLRSSGLGNPWERFVIVLAAVLVISGIILALQIERHQRAINATSRYDHSWMMSQGALEISAALIAAQDLRDRIPDAAELLQLRLDILQVRLDLFSHSDLGEVISAREEWRETRHALANALIVGNAMMARSADAEAALRIQAMLRPVEVALYRMANLSYVAGLQVLDLDISGLSDMHWRFSLVLALVVCCMVALILILRLRNRMIENANARIAATAEEMRLQNARFTAALNNMSQALCMVDGAGGLVVCNDRFAAMFALPEEARRSGTPIARVFAEAAPRVVDRALADALLTESLRCADEQRECGFHREDAQGRAIAVTQQPIEDGGWVATYEDITDRRRSEARIAWLAHHDSLTGLANRLMLTQALETALAKQSPFAVLYVDLDGFKSVNDVLGHMSGDALLQSVARRLEGALPAGALAARLGGDEFAIMAPGSGAAAAEALAEHVIASLADPFALGARTVVVGASVGIALCEGDWLSVGQLLRRADLALYAAKAAGRGTHRLWQPDIAVPGAA